MERVNPDEALQARIDEAGLRTLAWLDTLAAGPDSPSGVLRLDADHDPALWPGMLLPATYNGTMCRWLVGGLDGRDAEERSRLAGWIDGFRISTGAYRIDGMTDGNVYKKPDREETWRYIDFHVTNYALGALEALGAPVRAPAFVEGWLDPMTLKAWLADRDMRDPWQEGNNIVNLASFLLILRDMRPEKAAAVDGALGILFDWHDRNQDPGTGFWGVGQGLGGDRLLHAMAGSMHNFHLYYATGRALPYQRQAADYVLSRPTAWHSACIDVDEVDLLVHAMEDHPDLAPAGRVWLRQKLLALLDGQDAGGGFADTRDAGWRQDGWVGGYVTLPGAPTTFATWFRWIAIAMIDDALWPGRRTWHFRNMIGIGYRRPRTKG